MGPKVRYLGPEVPGEDLIWQDPVPAGTIPDLDAEVARSKAKDPEFGRSVSASWSRPPGPRRRPIASPTIAAAPMARASASHRRRTGQSTSPTELERCSPEDRASFAARRRHVSMADAIVLAGTAAVEKAARDAGFNVEVPFTAGSRRCFAGVYRRRKLRGDGAASRWLPQLPEDRFGEDRGAAARSCGAARAVGTGNDGAAGRAARARRQPREPKMACLPTGKGQLTNDSSSTCSTTRPSGNRGRRERREVHRLCRGGEEKWRATRTDLVFGPTASCAPPRRSMPRGR